MAVSIKDIMNEVGNLNTEIKRVLQQAQFENYEDLSAVEYDKADPNELMLVDELRSMLTKLEEVSHTINYLNAPVTKTGTLRRNETGRFEVDGLELQSGMGIEYLASDDWHSRYDENDNYVPAPYWCASRIEHNGDDYYIVGTQNIKLEGLSVRIRKL